MERSTLSQIEFPLHDGMNTLLTPRMMITSILASLTSFRVLQNFKGPMEGACHRDNQIEFALHGGMKTLRITRMMITHPF